jgi:hypothetical protein
MNPTSQKRTLAAVVAALLLAAGAFLFWHSRNHIATEDVAAFLDTTSGSNHVRFTVSKIEALGQDDSGRKLSVAAKAWPVQPLYTKADTADYLQRAFQIDTDSMTEARTLLTDKATMRNTQLTLGRPLPSDPFLAVILQPAAPADASFDYQGVVNAHRDGSRWVFSLVSGNFAGTGPQGDPRSTFGSPSFAIGDPADEARLRTVAADFQAFAGRVAEVHKNVERAKAAVVEGRRSAFLARIAAGRFFSGGASEAGEQNSTPLYLEITALAGNDVTAILRNEGSWHNGRVFQGTWAADDEFKETTLTLSSPAGQAVHNAGPFLENTQNWAMALNVDASGRMTEQNKFFQYRFQPMPPFQVATLRARLEAEFEQAVAATEPGSLYQGSATSRATGTAEPILLRFTTRSEDAKSLEAVIESTTRSWKRPLHGVIVDNARRSRGAPVRLTTAASEAAVDAPAGSVLGDQDDLEISFATRDAALEGGDANFTYALARTEETDRSKLAAGRAERSRHFLAVLRSGIAYDGAFREDQGFITHARLEVTRVDRDSGAMTAAIHSLARSRVFRDFSGTCDPAGGSIALTATSRGSFGEDGSFDIPFLTSASASTVHLELTGNSITGRIEGDPHWIMEFPTGSFLSATTESTEPNSPAANGSVFPTFPTGAGAYLLSHGSWLPLPKNNGHVVVETVRAKSDLQLPSNIIGALSEVSNAITREKDKQKVSYLVFDGKDSRPESSGPAMVILYVGPKLPGKAQLELASADLQKDGTRRIEIPGTPGAEQPKASADTSTETRAHPAPGEIRLGDQRLAAYVRGAGAGYTLFTSTSTLAPGPYVFNADASYELTEE